MKVLIFGVMHWNYDPPDPNVVSAIDEWYKRIKAFVPADDIFIATGNYSNPKIVPLSYKVPIIQNQVQYTEPYSIRQNYFRNGFMTGVWHALLNCSDWDILFHIQPRVLIGEDLTTHLRQFMKLKDLIMAPNLYSQNGKAVEVSCLAMKKQAVINWATRGYRATFMGENSNCLSSEQETYLLFENSWFNPWPDVMSTRQHDTMNNITCPPSHLSIFTHTNINQYVKLPLISTGKHASPNFIKAWRDNHPYV